MKEPVQAVVGAIERAIDQRSDFGRWEEPMAGEQLDKPTYAANAAAMEVPTTMANVGSKELTGKRPVATSAMRPTMTTTKQTRASPAAHLRMVRTRRPATA